MNDNISWKLYIPLTTLFTSYAVIKTNATYQKLFILLFVSILIIKPLEMYRYANHVDYNEQKRVFNRYILEEKEESLVITNNVQQRIGRYYNNFSKDSHVEIVKYDDFRFDSTDTRRKILFLNWYTRYLSSMDSKDLPYYAKNIPSSNRLLYENSDINAAIYEMVDFNIPEITGERLLMTINDFEGAIPFWSDPGDNISYEIKHSGNKSNMVQKYSSTFSFPMDSIRVSQTQKILIKSSVYCYFKDKTEAQIVISLEDDNGAYIWQASKVNPYIFAYSNWWPVRFEIEVNIDVIKTNSSLKIYLLNDDSDPGFIDDFEVEVIKILLN
jgi:hypothetical protein